jgi:hypothetical protein
MITSSLGNQMHWFAQMAEKMPDRLLINASERGSNADGWTHGKLSDVLAELPDRNIDVTAPPFGVPNADLISWFAFQIGVCAEARKAAKARDTRRLLIDAKMCPVIEAWSFPEVYDAMRERRATASGRWAVDEYESARAVMRDMCARIAAGLDGVDDVLIAGAAAEVSLDAVPNLVFAWIRVVVEQLLDRHDHARSAEPALQPVLVPKRFLDGVHVAIARHPFDRRDLQAVRLHREDRARLHRAPFEHHRASAAHRRLASDMRSRQLKIFTKKMNQKQARLDRPLILPAIHFHPNRLFHKTLPSCAINHETSAAQRSSQNHLHPQAIL